MTGTLFLQYGVGAGQRVGLTVANFIAEEQCRASDNLSSSGAVRERVVEATDVMVSFTSPGVKIGAEYENLATFLRNVIEGRQFQFYPNIAVANVYNCVLEDKSVKPAKQGFQGYSVSMVLRILNDGTQPVNSGEVMHAFWGLA